MIDYRTYEAEDFILDESFRRWALQADPQATAFWEAWQLQHPDRADVVRQARRLARNLSDYYADDATEDRIQQEVNRLMLGALDRSAQEEEPVRPLWYASPVWRWTAAACVVLLAAFGYWQYRTDTQQTAVSGTYAARVEQAGNALIEKTNTSAQTLNILLSDGSVVSLAPRSSISYPARFDKASRTVYLQGEAFFDVVKNPASPFLIYANHTITKVLGTSFVVRAYEDEPDVQVSVRTGRVSVYAQNDYERARQTGDRQLRGVVLTPNQQVTYNIKGDRLDKSLVERPMAILATIPSREQTFDDMPIAQMLLALEKTYGVDLVFNEDDLMRCRATISFAEENLMERLDVICQTVGASFEVIDGQIVIDSKGCQ
ncbi:FecR family protein [Arsenicibacter rosenii]|uniref:Iron dicitrate transport regulator FecR n=1 Tax=Arsenicibacter rosenii TaxID=1750698 RepID=A0A1S2VKW2_9BACT|nr:FecR family protein [Arsenicibacter rosenii]OIN59411.1 hypothetical protein BLX24_10595 [Arsenicibacter rosenii]